jgi:hypothetical protein
VSGQGNDEFRHSRSLGSIKGPGDERYQGVEPIHEVDELSENAAVTTKAGLQPLLRGEQESMRELSKDIRTGLAGRRVSYMPEAGFLPFVNERHYLGKSEIDSIKHLVIREGAK